MSLAGSPKGNHQSVCNESPSRWTNTYVEATEEETHRRRPARATRPGCGDGLEGCGVVREREEELSIEQLFQRFQSRARSIVGFHGIPLQDADDLVQQTYLTYLSRRAEVRRPEAWLAGTLNQRCLMFWRSRRRSWLSTAEDEFLEVAGSGDTVPQDQVAVRHDLSLAISRLPERSRLLLKLKFGLGLDSKEAARRLGYRYSGIYKITRRCLDALAKEMDSLGWNGASTCRGIATAGPRNDTGGSLTR